MREIETACGLRVSEIVNNSNLGTETTAETIEKSLDFAQQVSEKVALPIAFTAYNAEITLSPTFSTPLLPLTIPKKFI
jgi:hypothetical protein